MKKLLYPFAFALTTFLMLYSCSAEEEDTTPPPSVVATPEPEPPAPTQYTLEVRAGEGGTVSTEGGTYDEGTEVTITATPVEGYEFVGWEGSDSTEASLTVTIGANVTLNAIFNELIFTLKDIDILRADLEDIYNGASLAANSSVIFEKNGKLHLIFTPAIGRGDREYFLPIIHAVKNSNQWQVSKYYDEINMTFGGRDVDFIDTNNIFFADHGSEVHLTTGEEPKYNHVWYAKNISEDNIEWVRVSSDNAYYHNVSAGDLNYDGLLDAVAVNMSGFDDEEESQRMTAYIQKTDGTFEYQKIFNIPYGSNSIYDCYNYTRDNNLDKNNCPSEQKGAVLVEDIDNDGKPEIIVSSYNTYEYPDHYSDTGFDIWTDKNLDGIYEKYFFSDPIGWFDRPGLGTSQVKATDINNDGFKDLLIMFEGNFEGEYTGTADFNGISIYLNDGNGAFDLHQEIPLFDIRTAEFELLDFDNDGDDDIIFNVALGNCDLGGCGDQSTWINGNNNFIKNFNPNGDRYFDVDFNFDYLIWENQDSNFINIERNYSIYIEKGLSLYGDGLKFIKSQIIDGELLFYGVYGYLDENNIKKLQIFEYKPQ